jgi:hypothetical protein
MQPEPVRVAVRLTIGLLVITSVLAAFIWVLHHHLFWILLGPPMLIAAGILLAGAYHIGDDIIVAVRKRRMGCQK